MIANTAWAASLGLDVPIVCAPMGGVAGGALASAISRAGALGMLGMGSAASRDLLHRELDQLDLAGRPFGVGFVAWNLARDPGMLDRALAANAALISVSFMDWDDHRQREWVSQVRSHGAVAVTQVATVEEAILAEQLGVGAIVARGCEAGGHGDHQSPRGALLAAVREATALPVLAAGAIADAHDVQEVLGAGADAAWVGTAFAASAESLVSDAARTVLLEADGTDTVVTRVWDVAMGYPWPERFPERLIRTPFIDRWHGREEDLARDDVARAQFQAAVERADHRVVPVDAGTGVGKLTRVEPAARIVQNLGGHHCSHTGDADAPA